ncbi:MAG: ABC transporter permease [Micromonosporaceae bacterium]|jgi:putative ABC transport system permease protein|nr:ABC transporter permease [Micromonosporaceae bacterium]
MNALSSLGSVARLLRQRLERREGKQRVRADNTVVVPTSRLRLVDLVTEAVAGILQRTGRTALTIVGIVLGVAAFVAVLGVTATATGQISRRFTELYATEVTVTDVTLTDTYATATAFPADADQRVMVINGVRHAGVYWTIPAEQIGSVTGVPLPGVAANTTIPVIAASAGLFDAVRGHLAAGRIFDAALDQRGERVAVLGGAIAHHLGITSPDGLPAIFVGGVPFTVIGIVDTVQRRPELLAAVWIPRHTAEVLWPGPPEPGQPPQMVIDTNLGAAAVVARQVALALRPDAPNSFNAAAPPDPQTLRDQVSTDLSGLFLVLAGVCLVIGAVGIANTTLVAVLERVPEIGLRRALGAQRRHIAGQFLLESTTLGAVGGLNGAGIGVATIVAVAFVREWTPVMTPWTVLCAPAVGAITGLLAGIYPSLRAARIEPVDALRQ